MKDNAPHNALRNAVNRAIENGSPVIVEQSKITYDSEGRADLHTYVQMKKAELA